MVIYRNTNPKFGNTTGTLTGLEVQNIIDNLCAISAADLATELGISDFAARTIIADEFQEGLEDVEG